MSASAPLPAFTEFIAIRNVQVMSFLFLPACGVAVRARTVAATSRPLRWTGIHSSGPSGGRHHGGPLAGGSLTPRLLWSPPGGPALRPASAPAKLRVVVDFACGTQRGARQLPAAAQQQPWDRLRRSPARALGPLAPLTCASPGRSAAARASPLPFWSLLKCITNAHQHRTWQRQQW